MKYEPCSVVLVYQGNFITKVWILVEEGDSPCLPGVMNVHVLLCMWEAAPGTVCEDLRV